MKTISSTILTSFLKTMMPVCLIALSACEKDVEFEGPSEDKENNMVINALATEGEPLIVFLNYAYPIGQKPSTLNNDYQKAIFFDDNYITDYRYANYYLSAFILDADVTAIVNDKQTYHLSLASDSIGYVCNYRPQVNDHIVLKAKRISQEDGQSKVLTAETTVPAKPSIEVLNYEVLRDSSYYEMNQLLSYADTIMRITCRINDIGNEQYYRLRIRGERSVITETWNNPEFMREDQQEYEIEHFMTMQDIYFSEDQLFIDSRLNSNFGGWPAYFSNVFDNSQIQGNTYTFTLDSPKPNRHFGRVTGTDSSKGTIVWDTKVIGEKFSPRVMVELQAISPEFYRYLKSMQLYRITQSDAFSEPVQIFSNVQNGWGIFGSLSSQRIFISYE